MTPANRSLLKSLTAAVLVALCAAANGANHVASLAPYLNDDTFIVAHLDLASIDTVDWEVLPRLLSGSPDDAPVNVLALHAVANAIKSLQSAGIESAYFVLGLSDIPQPRGPLVILSLKPDGDAQAVENMLFALTPLLPNGRNPVIAKRHGPSTFLIGTEATVSKYESLAATQRDDLADSLAELTDDGAAVGAVLSPGSDFRRVVRELWPAMPAPLGELRGDLADRWLRLEFAAKTKPQLSANLVMQASDAKSAAMFAQLLRALPEAVEQFTEIGDRRHELKRVLGTIVETIPPSVDGSRVVMTLPSSEAQLATLRQLADEATDAALDSTRRQQRMQQFKQMALAMHNYYDVNKHFPPPAIRDTDGRPLLSWRVALLQYLEEDEPALFGKFHLDEPWDSPHNRALVQQMPTVYADPALPSLAREGKTTYVVPVGPGTVFDTKDGITYREITDGTSRTIMIVEVPADGAVIWTKPDDWKVDMSNPRHGIERTDRDKIVTVFCDGAALVMPMDIKPDVLRAFLTRGGRETVDWP